LEHASKLKNSGAQQKNSEDALQSMKEKMAIDASIVASQEDTINQLKSELMEAKQNNGKMQNQIGLFEAKILQHDEAVAHVRKVSNILQDDIKSKEKEVDDLKEKLDLTVKENKELHQKLAAKELTSDRKLEGFQENIKQQSETLTDLLQKLKEKENENEQRISQEVNSLKDEIAVKDQKLLTLERKLKAVEAANAELLNDLADKDKELNKNVKNAVNRIEIQAVENKLEEALLRNSDLTNKLAEKEKEMNLKLQTLEQKIRLGSHSVDSYGSHSDDSTQNRNNSNAVIAAARNYLDRPNNVNEVKEKQSQLQSELRDIYAQIRAVMPGLEMPTRCQTIESGKPSIEEGMDEMKENSISGVSTQRQLWEDKRPWRMQANNENANEVFNTEGWGSRSQASGNSVYNI
jgi:chromosome segregation ATPase